MTIEIIADPNEILGGGDGHAVLSVVMDGSGVRIVADGIHNSQIGSSTLDEHNRITLVWASATVPGGALACVESVRAIAGVAEPLIARVAAGYSTEWDGSNTVGVLDEDAQDASEDLARVMDDARWTRDDITVWDACEWISDDAEGAAREIGVDGMDDDEAATELEAWAAREHVALTDIGDAVAEMREALSRRGAGDG